VRIKQGMPVAVADFSGMACRVHDVGEQHGGENPVVCHFGLLTCEELGDLLEGIPPRFDEVENVRPRSST
jgi:hypothetical protein